jgi:micrococcal nuclease
MRALMVAAALAVAMGSAAQAAARTIEGRASVRDGDTVVVAGVPVRLKGVDAPERANRYGPDATKGMRAIAGDWLRCDLTGEKTRDREVGYCVNADGQDIGQEIISQGLALACSFYSRRYIPFEQPSAVARLPRAPYCDEKSAAVPPVPKAPTIPPLAKTLTVPPVSKVPPAADRAPGIKCMYPDDLDSRGHRCGKRAASERPGGH